MEPIEVFHLVVDFLNTKVYQPTLKVVNKVNSVVSTQSGWKSGFLTALGLNFVLRAMTTNSVLTMFVAGLFLFLAKKDWDDNAKLHDQPKSK